MGRRTSVYLSDDLVEAVEASGVPLADLIRKGLGLAPCETVAGIQVLTDERVPEGVAVLSSPSGGSAKAMRVRPARTSGPQERRCTHPGKRVIGGWCPECEAEILPGGRFRIDAEAVS